jgi:hypothetical protein
MRDGFGFRSVEEWAFETLFWKPYAGTNLLHIAAQRPRWHSKRLVQPCARLVPDVLALGRQAELAESDPELMAAAAALEAAALASAGGDKPAAREAAADINPAAAANGDAAAPLKGKALWPEEPAAGAVPAANGDGQHEPNGNGVAVGLAGKDRPPPTTEGVLAREEDAAREISSPPGLTPNLGSCYIPAVLLRHTTHDLHRSCVHTHDLLCSTHDLLTVILHNCAHDRHTAHDLLRFCYVIVGRSLCLQVWRPPGPRIGLTTPLPLHPLALPLSC